jgi:hypothetical protein
MNQTLPVTHIHPALMFEILGLGSKPPENFKIRWNLVMKWAAWRNRGAVEL